MLNIGDIVKLKFGTFLKYPGKLLVDSNHLFVVVDDMNVCEISSNISKINEKYPYNIPITYWKECGLNKPSHIKTDCYGEVSNDNVFKTIGHLKPFDLNKLLDSFSTSPQNYLLEWVTDKEEYTDV